MEKVNKDKSNLNPKKNRDWADRLKEGSPDIIRLLKKALLDFFSNSTKK